MASVPSGNYEVDPISRIEGHLGVKVHVGSGGTIDEAWAHGNLWRGFENFLIGRQANDAITFTQRICGVCPLPHATAATFATESVLGVSDGYITFANDGSKGVPRKAVLIRNLVYAAEFVMSSITHFYHLTAQSYVQGPNMPPWTPYYDHEQYSPYLLATNGTSDRILPELGTVSGGTAFSKDLWSAVITQYLKALRMRRLTLEAGALFAGRMPMVSSFVAGGVTNETSDSMHSAKCTAFETAMGEVGQFVLKEYVPLALSLGALYPEYDNTNNDALVDAIPVHNHLKHALGYGEGCKNFLSWGAFPGGVSGDGTGLVFNGGYKIGATATHLFMSDKTDLVGAKTHVADSLSEFIVRSRYADALGEFGPTATSAYPGNVSRTEPKRDLASKYSWLKAPRWKVGSTQYPMEVGPLARLIVNNRYGDGDPILTKAGYFDTYTKSVTSSASGSIAVLDPKMVAPDLGVALVRAKFAKLLVTSSSGDLLVTDGNISSLTSGQIVEAYTNTGAYAAANSGIVDGADVPLVTWLTTVRGGASVIDRLRARALEAAVLVQQMIGTYSKGSDTFGSSSWIDALKAQGAEAGYRAVAVPVGTVSGFGVSEAPRGALAHFITATNGKIVKYQCVVPTTWNASPKHGSGDGVAGERGPMEQAMIGVPFENLTVSGHNSGIEVARVAQSFDPCIACAVH
jgi:hydrogenase large subunit